MRSLLPFLVCLMLVLTAWVGVVHAAEVGGCVEAGQYAAGSHVDGDADADADADQVAADADKGYPHHHGNCHAHHMRAADAGTLAGMTDQTRSMLASAANAALVGRNADTALRPPQA